MAHPDTAKRILVIEDDNNIRLIIKMVLEKEGYAVAEACDGEEGIEKFHEHPADLVITDILMPRKDGLNTIDELLHEYPDIKIIAISGGCTIEPERYLTIAKTLGAQQILQKPFTPDTLLELVNQVLYSSSNI